MLYHRQSSSWLLILQRQQLQMGCVCVVHPVVQPDSSIPSFHGVIQLVS